MTSSTGISELPGKESVLDDTHFQVLCRTAVGHGHIYTAVSSIWLWWLPFKTVFIYLFNNYLANIYPIPSSGPDARTVTDKANQCLFPGQKKGTQGKSSILPAEPSMLYHSAVSIPASATKTKHTAFPARFEGPKTFLLKAFGTKCLKWVS